MRHPANILITVTALIILILCGGKVCLSQCGCSGKISLMLPGDKGCCPSESDCMTVTTLQVSDSDLTANVDLSNVPVLLTFSPEFPATDCPIPIITHIYHQANIAPPGITQSMVMRV